MILNGPEGGFICKNVYFLSLANELGKPFEDLFRKSITESVYNLVNLVNNLFVKHHQIQWVC